MQGTFLLSHLWARILFDYGASHSVVRELGLEVETLEEPLYASSPLGSRVSVDLICRGCELEIYGILLTVDLRVMAHVRVRCHPWDGLVDDISSHHRL